MKMKAGETKIRPGKETKRKIQAGNGSSKENRSPERIRSMKAGKGNRKENQSWETKIARKMKAGK